MSFDVEAVYFLSDGDPNAGKISVPEAIIAAVVQANRVRRISVYTIGICPGPAGGPLDNFMRAGRAEPGHLPPRGPLTCISHQHVGWVEQTANLVGLRSLAGRRFPRNLGFKRMRLAKTHQKPRHPSPTLREKSALAMTFPGFRPTLFEFLEQLADNNNRPWFQENKSRYERDVREPALAFIRAFQPRLKRLSAHFLASDRSVGGSLMRVYRETRFAKDGQPYKTNVGVQFRHEQGRDIHAPGFYVHVAPGECFLAVGLCRPPALAQIRRAIVQWPDRWRRARDDRKFRRRFSLDGGSLKCPPTASRPTIRGSRTSNGRTSSGLKNSRSGTFSAEDSSATWPRLSPPVVRL